MSGRRTEKALGRLAQRLRISLGQAYTVVTGVLVATVLAVIGLPPVFEGVDRPAVPGAQAAAPAVDGGDGPTTDPDFEADLAIGLAPVLRGGSSPSLSFGDDDGAVATPATAVPPTAPPSGPTAPPRLGVTSRFASVPEPGAPGGVALGPDGTVYVVTDNALTRGGGGASALLAYSPTGRLLETWLAAGQGSPRSHGLTDVVVDGAGTVWVLDGDAARILRLDRAKGGLVEAAVVPDVPACLVGLVAAPCESGLADNAPELRGLAARAGGGVLVADRTQGIVWSLAPGGRPTLLTGIDDRLAGEGPVDVAVLGDGSLVVVLSARLGSAPPGLPSILRIPMPGGAPDGPVVIADLALADAPTSVVTTASGRLYVALSGADEVADVGVEHGDVVRHGAGLDPAFDVPSGLALGPGSLLVTNQGPAGAGPDRWAVLALAVADRPPAL